MRTSTCKTFSILGVDALTVNVAAAAEPGPDRFALVGLSETSIRECAVRVETAIEAAGFLWPKGRITVDLAPADLHKEGSGFDLPIAAAILTASRQIGPLDGLALVGELAFDGRVLPIRGALPAALEAGRGAILVIPEGNALEASAAEAGCVLSLSHISELPDLLTTLRSVQEQHPSLAWTKEPSGIPAWFPTDPSSIDMADVHGQPAARRAMEVAAAGGHSLLLQGPPGTGKTMLARRLTTILPPLTRPEAVETSTVYSTRGLLPPGEGLLRTRPFRAPHHTISTAALMGGGIGGPRAGEVSLAHNGVLFLDELPEFQRSTLDMLPAAMEGGEVAIGRASRTVRFPAKLQLVASMNPCPCGYHGDSRCSCSTRSVESYQGRIAERLLDQIDLRVEVQPITHRQLANVEPGESSAAIRERVIAARDFRAQHPEKTIAEEAHALLPAGVHDVERRRICAVAMTIADLDASQEATAAHVEEAIGLCRDQK
ncbi:MAG: YifB family Mg chelatase-like AAA ATPase [Actinomycetota bacterium]